MPHQILIADADADTRLALAYLLQREGFAVLEAADGPQALEALRRHRPGLVLMEVAMPGCDGFAVCRALRADEALRQTRVLLLTARSAAADRAQGLALGADAYLTKPVATRELVQQVHALLPST